MKAGRGGEGGGTEAAGVQLVLPEELAGQLGAEGQSRGGARHLRHLVQEKVEGPLSVYLLKTEKHPTKVEGILHQGDLQFTG